MEVMKINTFKRVTKLFKSDYKGGKTGEGNFSHWLNLTEKQIHVN